MTAEISISFEYPEFYNLYMTSHAHGWKSLSPFSWDEDSQMLQFAVMAGECPVRVECRQLKRRIQVTLFSHTMLTDEQVKTVRAMIRRALGLDIHTQRLFEKAEKIHPPFAELIKNGAGRMLRSPTIWEDAAKTLFTTNCTWALTKIMCDAMCSSRFTPETPGGAHPFPPPETIAGYSSERLKKTVSVGYRAGYVTALARCFVADPYLCNLETDGLDYDAADGIVRRLKGFADYACAHLLILAGYSDKIPVDTTVVSFLKENYRVRKPHSFIARHYRKWGSDRWWGYHLDRMMTLRKFQ